VEGGLGFYTTNKQLQVVACPEIAKEFFGVAFFFPKAIIRLVANLIFK
jgi:hypothetical protein